jgi:hypothetical protein
MDAHFASGGGPFQEPMRLTTPVRMASDGVNASHISPREITYQPMKQQLEFFERHSCVTLIRLRN